MTAACIESTTDLILGEERSLRRDARRLSRCEADADDLVQETLLRAYRARDRFTPGTSVRAWTATILRRLFLTKAITDQRRAVGTVADGGELLETAVDRRSSSRGDAAADLRALGERLEDPVKRALDRVPEVYREAFLLASMRELSCAEIGARLRVPRGTVMSRIHRARAQMRGDLVHYGGGRSAAARTHQIVA